jgi:hypothetical protein
MAQSCTASLSVELPLMRSGAGRGNNSGRVNDGLGTTYGRGLLAASGTALGLSFEKIMEDTGLTEYPVDYCPPILPRNPELPRSFRPAIRRGRTGERSGDHWMHAHHSAHGTRPPDGQESWQ